MQAGHLQVEDGIGHDRRRLRLARVNHTLKRLVCVGDDGFITLAALRFLSEVGASFTMLDRRGKVASSHRACITQRGATPQIARASARKWQGHEDRPRTHFSQTQRARSLTPRKTEEHTSSGFHRRTSGLFG